MTKVEKLGYLVSGILLASSFLIKDNSKAVNRRYWAIGIAAGTFGYAKLSAKTKLI